jgi:hypothetical protein
LTRDHVHDATDSVSAEEGALWAAHDFDALDLGDGHLREVEAAAKRVGANAIDEDEGVIRLAAAREDRGERAGSAAARHGEAGHGAQRGPERGHLPRFKLVPRDHGDAVSGPRQRLIDLRCRDDQRLGDGADAKHDVWRDCADAGGDAARFAQQPWRGNSQVVSSVGETVKRVAARFIGSCRSRRARQSDRHHRRRRNRTALLIDNAAFEA